MFPGLPLPMLFPAKRIRTILALFLWVVLSVVPATAQVAWRMTTEYPQNNISGIGLTTFASRVAARTNGFVTVTNAFDNELKISSGEMPRAAQDGRIVGGDALQARSPASTRYSVFPPCPSSCNRLTPPVPPTCGHARSMKRRSRRAASNCFM